VEGDDVEVVVTAEVGDMVDCFESADPFDIVDADGTLSSESESDEEEEGFAT
jgi:hypothetical protein